MKHNLLKCQLSQSVALPAMMVS